MQFDENITTPPLISILHREHAKYLNEKVMDYDEKWDLKIKECLTKEEYDNLKRTLLKICEVLV